MALPRREFIILVHYGVGPIHLGMTRSEVHEHMGDPQFVRKGDGREMFLSGFMVDFDQDGRVKFIELAKSDRYRALFEGRCLHELPADDAVALVSKFAAYDENHRELGYSYIFPDLQLSLWRDHIPDPEQPLDEPDGRYFETVGIAAAGYFS
jgi:hypothetical protein